MPQENLDNILNDFVNKETNEDDNNITNTEEETLENDNKQPFKVYENQEDFDKHAKGLKKSAEHSILKSLGFETIEALQEKLKGEPLVEKEKTPETKDVEETTPIEKSEGNNNLDLVSFESRLNELEATNESLKEELNNKKIENRLLSENISKDNIDYVMLDLIKHNINMNDEKEFKEFINNSKFKGKDISFNPTKDVIDIEELANLNAKR